jgi:hypothetical protein
MTGQRKTPHEAGLGVAMFERLRFWLGPYSPLMGGVGSWLKTEVPPVDAPHVVGAADRSRDGYAIVGSVGPRIDLLCPPDVIRAQGHGRGYLAKTILGYCKKIANILNLLR